MLQWARANGCGWDWTTCSFAALGGHLEVLQWAKTNGCPWDKGVVLAHLGRLGDPVQKQEALAWANAHPD